MPDPNVLRDAVRRSAFGHFAHDPGLTNWQVGEKIIARMGIPPGGDRVRVQNYVRGARRQWDDAQAANQPGAASTPYVPSTPDPSLTGEIGQYRYRVVVTITDPDTGDRYSTVVIVDSTIPLSPTEIRQRARAAWTSIRGPDRNYYERTEGMRGWESTEDITGGGRA